MVDDARRGFDLSDDDWDAEVDDDFLFHLVQGGGLMRSGRMVEAKEHLEKAFSLKPDNARGQNMLGLVYFKLGLYQRAIDIGRSLIERYPEDVTLKVNLAMIQLKAGQLEQAEGSLQAALLLDADHINAHRYLGLVSARLGRLDEARRHFERAGVQDVERLLAEGQSAQMAAAEPDSAPPKQEALDQVEAEGYRDLERSHAAVLEAGAVSDPGEPRMMGQESSTFSEPGPVEMGSDLQMSAQEEPAAMASIPPIPDLVHEKALSELDEPDGESGLEMETEAVEAVGADVSMSPTPQPMSQPKPASVAPSVTEAVTIPEALPRSEHTFHLDGDCLRLSLPEAVYLRAGEFRWISGDVKFTTVYKRFAGKETRHPFDRGEQAMVLAEGSGQIQTASPDGSTLFLVNHAEDSLYLAEQNVFAFSATESWENGRLPAVKGADLAIFHLFSPAQVVLRLERAYVKHRLEGEGRFRLHVGQLVGWTGDLVPKLF